MAQYSAPEWTAASKGHQTDGRQQDRAPGFSVASGTELDKNGGGKD